MSVCSTLYPGRAGCAFRVALINVDVTPPAGLTAVVHAPSRAVAAGVTRPMAPVVFVLHVVSCADKGVMGLWISSALRGLCQAAVSDSVKYE